MMTNEIEKKFFEAFGIPKRFYALINIGDLDYQAKKVSSPTLRKLWNQVEWDLISHEDIVPETFAEFKKSNLWVEDYPEITDGILLELMLLALNNDFVVHAKNLNELQEKILYLLTKNANDKSIYTLVRKQFGEK